MICLQPAPGLLRMAREALDGSDSSASQERRCARRGPVGDQHCWDRNQTGILNDLIADVPEADDAPGSKTYV